MRDMSSSSSLASQGTGVNASFLRVTDVGKNFGGFQALSNVTLDIKEGEFVCFLGPSGCGKSTLLRIIAGLERQDGGTIHSRNQDISNLPPAQRKFGILFQSYALFPNLNVHENIVYGLRNQHLSKAEIDSRLKELIELIDLKGSEKKYPAQLSGGQQQRVALARAIAPSPRLLLLDEPLSALDAKVRVHLRQQIRDLQRRLGLTTIMVTHDQEEALSMADRVVAMRNGEVEQIGTPTEIYHTPRSIFVAGFVGKMNILQGHVSDGQLTIGDLSFPVSAAYATAENQGNVLACLRPEQVRLRRAADSGQGGALPAQVTHLEFLGSFWRVSVSVPALGHAKVSADLSSYDMAGSPVSVGDHVGVVLPHERFAVFPAVRPDQAQAARPQ
jgi:iron(III) transport system ATP-binding protein